MGFINFVEVGEYAICIIGLEGWAVMGAPGDDYLDDVQREFNDDYDSLMITIDRPNDDCEDLCSWSYLAGWESKSSQKQQTT